MPAAATHILFQLAHFQRVLGMRCCKLGSTVVKLDDGDDMEDRVKSLYKAEADPDAKAAIDHFREEQAKARAAAVARAYAEAAAKDAAAYEEGLTDEELKEQLEKRNPAIARIIFADNPSDVLGLPESAGDEAIKKKYKQLSLEVHPDQRQGCHARDGSAGRRDNH